MFTARILIIGKSGVGKSSLLNYLFGDNIAKVGDGRPVTGYGIFEYPQFSYKKINIVAYDSWGLEQNKAYIWKKYIEEEVQKNNEKNINDWFHTIIYCIDASGARIEDFEIDEVLKPLISSGNRIVFAFTKSDLATNVQKHELSKVIHTHFQEAVIVQICSVTSKLRNGSLSYPFNKELLFEKASSNLHENIFRKSVANFTKRLHGENLKIKRNVNFFYKENAGILNAISEYFIRSIFRYFQEQIKNAYAKTQRRLEQDLACLDEEVDNISYSFNSPKFPPIKNSIVAKFTDDFYHYMMDEIFVESEFIKLIPLVNKIYARFIIKEKIFNFFNKKLIEFDNDVEKLAQNMICTYRQSVRQIPPLQ